MRESIFPFWQNSEFHNLSDMPVTPADDAWRPEANQGGEQWLFEVITETNYVINITVNTRPWGLEGSPMLSWLVRSPDGKLQGRNIPIARDVFQASTTSCQLNLGPHYIAGDDSQYIVQIKVDDFNLDLKFEPLVNSWKPGKGKIAFGGTGDQFLEWVVPVPRASVQGQLKLGHTTKQLIGTGYHDHRRANFDLAEAINYIIWGRCYSEAETMIFSNVVCSPSYDRAIVPALYFHSDGHLLSTPNLEVFPSRWQKTAIQNLSIPTNLQLRYEANHLAGEGRITFKELYRPETLSFKGISVPHLPTTVFSLGSLALAKLNYPLNQLKARSICEIMRF